jgi:hypothetical protein
VNGLHQEEICEGDRQEWHNVGLQAHGQVD